MAWRTLPGSAALTEFGKYTGDCMWDALLSCLHVIDGINAPLTLDALNALTAKAIAAGLAGARGQSSLGQVIEGGTRWYNLAPVRQLGYQVGLPARDDPARKITGWISVIQQRGGLDPILLMLENAQALPDNEKGVFRHGIAVLGVDPDNAVLMAANGDSSNARAGRWSIYTLEHVIQAQPSGLLVYPHTIKPPTPTPSPTPDPGAQNRARALELIVQAEAFLRAV